MYKRVLLKMSGEALAGRGNNCYNRELISDLLIEIKEIMGEGFQAALVVGGGNYWRGKENAEVNRVTSDYIGMMATAMNALFLSDFCNSMNIDNVIMSPIAVGALFETFSKSKAINCLNEGKLVIMACGTGHPYFSTDSAAALFGSQIEADAILMLKSGVDGIYTKNPKISGDSAFIEKLTYDEIIKNDEIEVFDKAVCNICGESGVTTIVCGFEKGNIGKAVRGDKIGTIVTRY